MPTGYTADIKDGISFEQFALNCAKAFGACISMRDSPSDTPIPEEFEPSTYHADQAVEARDELVLYENMPFGTAVEASSAEYRREELLRKQRLQENADMLECYRRMLNQVRVWIAPTKEHASLKDFMVKQIEESIRFDDSTKYWSKPTPIVSVTNWLEAKKAKALEDIKYHEEKNIEELKRIAQRNLWVRQLCESLK